MQKVICSLVFVFCFFVTRAQLDINPDSLKLEIANTKVDSVKVKKIAKLCIYYLITGHYKDAEKYTMQMRAIAVKNKFTKTIALSYNFMGSIYDDNGKYPEAIEAYLQAQKLFEECNHKKSLSDVANNLGLVYFNIGEYEKAMVQLEKAIALATEMGMRHALHNPLHAIGQIYSQKEDHLKAMEYYKKAMALRIEFQMPDGLVSSYLSIGNTYQTLGNLDSAVFYHRKCLDAAKLMNEPKQMAFAESVLGASLVKTKKYAEANEHLENALKIGKEAELMEVLKTVYKDQSTLYENTGKHEKALIAYKNYIGMRDSMFNEENTKKALNAELSFEYEKKQAVAKAEQDKTNALHAEESKRKNIILLFVGIIAVVIFVVVIIVFRNLRVTRKQKQIIEEQKIVVDQAFEKLHEKNKEVMDSIYYARRIQRALITNEKYINKSLRKLNGGN
jgi:tetratricopeptide (TPR) repeat protein